MQFAAILPRSSSATIRIARIDVISTSLLFLFLCVWHWRVTGGLTVQAIAALGLFGALCMTYGRLFVAATSTLFPHAAGLPFQLLSGYLVFNSLLFVLALCSPFGMVVNLAVLSLLGAAGYLVSRKHLRPSATAPGESAAALVAILLAGIGATIWCGDAQTPIRLQDSAVIFRVWPDTFIHAREISVFAQSHGVGTIHDIRLAGGSAPIYHFASYLSPAAISVLSGASAMEVYASLQLPVGIVLTGLAAYCLAASLFGCWAGVAGVVALLLFPDAFHQGFGNRYLSYNFLAQVNLGMLYGIACAALAWIFVIDGCRRGKIGTIALGYVFLLICLFYKAHLFVANSYLLMMFPIMFFMPLRTRWRIALAIAATALFVSVVAISQSHPRVPVLRLDGSGIGPYLITLLTSYESGFLKSFFTRVFIEETHGKPLQGIYAIALLLISTFGMWLFAFPATLISGRARIGVPLLSFPLLVVANYLLMSMGLAPDSRSVGSFDELLNRPLVWAYFVLAVWTSGAAYYLFIGNGLPRQKAVRVVLLASILVAIGSTMFHAPNLQTFPERGFKDFAQIGSLPSCMVKAAHYVRTHSGPDELAQDAANDPILAFTALTERQLYVGMASFGGKNLVQAQRLAEMEQVKHISDMSELQQFMAERGIGWYLAFPETRISWPAAFAQRPAFACGDYRLFRFGEPLLSQPGG